MTRKEGGLPEGGLGLSNYVSRALDDIARQKAEAERQRIEAKDREMEAFLQRTALLRVHLMELAKPLDELLARFRVRELFEEVQSLSGGRGIIKELRPPIYRDIVLQPNPAIRCVSLLKQHYDLHDIDPHDHINFDLLLDRESIHGLIPALVGDTGPDHDGRQHGFSSTVDPKAPKFLGERYGLTLERNGFQTLDYKFKQVFIGGMDSRSMDGYGGSHTPGFLEYGRGKQLVTTLRLMRAELWLFM